MQPANRQTRLIICTSPEGSQSAGLNVLMQGLWARLVEALVLGQAVHQQQVPCFTVTGCVILIQQPHTSTGSDPIVSLC